MGLLVLRVYDRRRKVNFHVAGRKETVIAVFLNCEFDGRRLDECGFHGRGFSRREFCGWWLTWRRFYGRGLGDFF